MVNIERQRAATQRTTKLNQILFSIIVLGLSVTLNDCYSVPGVPNSIRAQFRFIIFAGIFGLIDSAIGLAAIFIAVIPSIVVTAVDALAAIFVVAGGAVRIPPAREADRNY